MKKYTQVYVKNSMEAAQTYCKAFGTKITFEIKNASGTAYEHCQLSVNGEGFLAIGEAKNPCDVAFIHNLKWEPRSVFAARLMFCVMESLSLKRFTVCRGADAVPPLLINMVYAGGLQFNKDVVSYLPSLSRSFTKSVPEFV